MAEEAIQGLMPGQSCHGRHSLYITYSYEFVSLPCYPLYIDEVLQNQVERWRTNEISVCEDTTLKSSMCLSVDNLEKNNTRICIKMVNFQKFQNGKCSISTHYKVITC